jgi:hypothetical protein
MSSRSSRNVLWKCVNGCRNASSYYSAVNVGHLLGGAVGEKFTERRKVNCKQNHEQCPDDFVCAIRRLVCDGCLDKENQPMLLVPKFLHQKCVEARCTCANKDPAAPAARPPPLINLSNSSLSSGPVTSAGLAAAAVSGTRGRNLYQGAARPIIAVSALPPAFENVLEYLEEKFRSRADQAIKAVSQQEEFRKRVERYDTELRQLSSAGGRGEDAVDARMAELRNLKGRMREDRQMAAEGLEEEEKGLERLMAKAISAASAVTKAKAALEAAASFATVEFDRRSGPHGERRRQKRARLAKSHEDLDAAAARLDAEDLGQIVLEANLPLRLVGQKRQGKYPMYGQLSARQPPMSMSLGAGRINGGSGEVCCKNYLFDRFLLACSLMTTRMPFFFSQTKILAPTMQCVKLVQRLCAVFRHQDPTLKFTTVSVGSGRFNLHVDQSNAGSSAIISGGQDSGGGLWVFDCATNTSRVLDCQGRVQRFHGSHCPHYTLPSSGGERVAVVAYCCKYVGDLFQSPLEVQFLESCGFNLPSKDELAATLAADAATAPRSADGEALTKHARVNLAQEAIMREFARPDDPNRPPAPAPDSEEGCVYASGGLDSSDDDDDYDEDGEDGEVDAEIGDRAASGGRHGVVTVETDESEPEEPQVAAAFVTAAEAAVKEREGVTRALISSSVAPVIAPGVPQTFTAAGGGAGTGMAEAEGPFEMDPADAIRFRCPPAPPVNHGAAAAHAGVQLLLVDAVVSGASCLRGKGSAPIAVGGPSGSNGGVGCGHRSAFDAAAISAALMTGVFNGLLTPQEEEAAYAGKRARSDSASTG